MESFSHLSLIINNLNITGAIAEINENQTAMVTATGYPAAENNALPHFAVTKLTAVVGALKTFQSFHYSFTSYRIIM